VTLQPQVIRVLIVDDPAKAKHNELRLIKNLLLETLQGKISYETLTAIDDLGELEDVPEPYREVLALVQGSREDG
jgi:hypothetical protein